MTVRVAINGFGRIGRNVVRALYENGYRDLVEIVAINDVAGDAKTNAHLLQYDSVHGRFAEPVSYDDEMLHIRQDEIHVFNQPAPAKLPWASLGIDVVFECSGRLTHGDKARDHINAGSPRVLISAPADAVDATIVYGVNHHQLRQQHQVVSNASCTTNCLAPVAQVLDQAFGIEQGMMTTVHAYTNDQQLLDAQSDDLYRARAALQSMIPTRTGAAKALGEVLPQLDGRIDGMAIRVPVANVSVLDLSVITRKDVDVEKVNGKVAKAASRSKILDYVEAPLVSTDFNHHSVSAIFDASQTRVQKPRLLRIMAWYDNEWGFSNRMLDTAIAWISARE